ncbi:transcription elongation factor subunit Spt4 [Acidilobus saccharovorans]|uniref:transcription elongation factor subunit Spt4 n=1 Tax=Acidilobus saccharovorans TaxID=242703 RepID=UPI000AEC4274|nr:transcription elongation factor subunit Spt4 [Acidilobus saccharovorans]
MPVRAPTKRMPYKACKNCGALVPRDSDVCPVCGGTAFVDDWDGVVVVLDNSELAARLKFAKKGMFALKVSGSYVFK